MTDKQHPFTPPHDKVYWWWEEACKRPPSSFYEKLDYVAGKAAQLGADQELEACCDWLIDNQNPRWAAALRAARRPKPPSLAEEALKTLEQTVILLMPVTGRKKIERFDTIRRALKRLKQLEGQ